jgi:hypothetical protein
MLSQRATFEFLGFDTVTCFRLPCLVEKENRVNYDNCLACRLHLRKHDTHSKGKNSSWDA